MKYRKTNKSFQIGYSKAIDLFATNKKSSEPLHSVSDWEALKQDYNALRGDWNNVGRDIQRAVTEYRCQQ